MSDNARGIVEAELEASVRNACVHFLIWGAFTALLVGGSVVMTSGWRPGAATVGLLIFGAVFVVAVIEALSAFSTRRELQRDLRSGEIVRCVGPLRAVSHGGGEDPVLWYVELGKRTLRSPWHGQEPPFAELLSAQVDHTPCFGLVLEIQDRDGLEVYRRAGYRPETAR
jgi:hypothetical protein